MSRYIDADALIEKYTVVIRKTADEKLKTEIAVLLKDIEDAPTIDTPTIGAPTIDAIPIDYMRSQVDSGKWEEIITRWREHEKIH